MERTPGAAGTPRPTALSARQCVTSFLASVTSERVNSRRLPPVPVGQRSLSVCAVRSRRRAMRLLISIPALYRDEAGDDVSRHRRSGLAEILPAVRWVPTSSNEDLPLRVQSAGKEFEAGDDASRHRRSGLAEILPAVRWVPTSSNEDPVARAVCRRRRWGVRRQQQPVAETCSCSVGQERSVDRARSRCQGRQPRAAGAERSDAP